MKSLLLILILIFSAGELALAAAPQCDDVWTPAYAPLPARSLRNILRVPLVRQFHDYDCGSASLLSVLYYYRAYSAREDQIMKWAKTSKNGTSVADLVKAANHHEFNLQAEDRQNVSLNEVLESLADKRPMILNLQAWRDSGKTWENEWESGHFVVAVGSNKRSKLIYLMDPSTPGDYAYITFDELQKRWHDYDVIDGNKVIYNRLAIFFKKPARQYVPVIQHMD